MLLLRTALAFYLSLSGEKLCKCGVWLLVRLIPTLHTNLGGSQLFLPTEFVLSVPIALPGLDMARKHFRFSKPKQGGKHAQKCICHLGGSLSFACNWFYSPVLPHMVPFGHLSTRKENYFLGLMSYERAGRSSGWRVCFWTEASFPSPNLLSAAWGKAGHRSIWSLETAAASTSMDVGKRKGDATNDKSEWWWALEYHPCSVLRVMQNTHTQSQLGTLSPIFAAPWIYIGLYPVIPYSQLCCLKEA